MNAQLAIDFDAARDARDTGIARSIDHANKEELEWSGQAMGYLRMFIDQVAGDRAFIIEEVRLWAHANGLPPPPDMRAWGGVTQRAKGKKNPIIVKVEGQTALAASSNLSPKQLYRRAQPRAIP